MHYGGMFAIIPITVLYFPNAELASLNKASVHAVWLRYVFAKMYICVAWGNPETKMYAL